MTCPKCGMADHSPDVFCSAGDERVEQMLAAHDEGRHAEFEAADCPACRAQLWRER